MAGDPAAAAFAVIEGVIRQLACENALCGDPIASEL